MKNDNLVGTTVLRERGWTPSMINRFLGDPDKLVKNPHYRSGPPMKLYDIARIEEAERLPDFGKAAEVAASRSRAALSAADRKRKELLESVAKMAVTVEVLDTGIVLASAIESYNDRQAMREWGDVWPEPASPQSDKAFLERIQINHIRHCLTDYDHALEDVAGRVGVHEAVTAIRRKVYQAIASAYPALAGECRRQMAYRGVHSLVEAS